MSFNNSYINDVSHLFVALIKFIMNPFRKITVYTF